MKPTILALDLEGTLISNAISQFPRPGLYQFLAEAKTQFDHLVVITTVPRDRFYSIAETLVQEGAAPTWFRAIPYIDWHGATKDLRFVSPKLGDALLLDDHGAYVHAGQERLWVRIPLFVPPYTAEDNGLELALRELLARIEDFR